jgi:hypothetical protein
VRAPAALLEAVGYVVVDDRLVGAGHDHTGGGWAGLSRARSATQRVLRSPWERAARCHAMSPPLGEVDTHDRTSRSRHDTTGSRA